MKYFLCWAWDIKIWKMLWNIELCLAKIHNRDWKEYWMKSWELVQTQAQQSRLTEILCEAGSRAWTVISGSRMLKTWKFKMSETLITLESFLSWCPRRAAAEAALRLPWSWRRCFPHSQRGVAGQHCRAPARAAGRRRHHQPPRGFLPETLGSRALWLLPLVVAVGSYSLGDAVETSLAALQRSSFGSSSL